MQLAKVFFCGVAGACLGACGTEEEHAASAEDPYAGEIIGIRDGHIEGQVGPRVVDGASSPLDFFSGPTQLIVVSVVQIEDHAVMLQLTLDLDEELLVPGVRESVTFSSGPHLRLLACVGQSIGVYDEYEAIADELTLVVEDAEDGELGDVLVTATGGWSRPHADPPVETRVATSTFILER